MDIEMGVTMRSGLIKANFLIFSLLCVLLKFVVVSFSQTIDPTVQEDPFYEQKGTDQFISERTTSPFQQVSESIDPFTGNLNLLHTDIILPGDGGLDLKIQRAYNSRIWGRKDISNPALLAVLLKMVLKDRITDDEIQLICDVFYHD